MISVIEYPNGIVPPPDKYISQPIKKKLTQIVGRLRFVLRFSDGLIKTELVTGQPSYPDPIMALDLWAMYLEDEARTCGYSGHYIIEAKVVSHIPNHREEIEIVQRYDEILNPDWQEWSSKYGDDWDKWAETNLLL